MSINAAASMSTSLPNPPLVNTIGGSFAGRLVWLAHHGRNRRKLLRTEDKG
jgi:hypothetical protein